MGTKWNTQFRKVEHKKYDLSLKNQQFNDTDTASDTMTTLIHW